MQAEDGTTVTTGVEETQTPASTEPVSGEGTAPAEDVFYDANMVPEALRPSYTKMQAAFTKKTQEVAEARKAVEWLNEYGEADEVKAFLEQFKSPEKVLEWWSAIAEELGISGEALTKLLQGEQAPAPGTPSATPGGLDPNRPMTFAEYQAIQQRQAAEAQQAADDVEVEQALRSLNITDPDEESVVLGLALRQPEHLGYSERLKRAHAAYQKSFDARMAAAGGESADLNSQSPKGLGGNAPTGGEAAPETMEEAKNRSRILLDRLWN